MSTPLNDAKKLLRGSEGESKFQIKTFGILALSGLVIWVALNAFNGKGPVELVESLQAQRPMPTGTEVSATVTPTRVYIDGSIDNPLLEGQQGVFRDAETPVPPTPYVVTQQEVVVVTVEVPGPVVYMEVPGPVVEVTRIVEHPVLVVAPTPTATPSLAAGSVRICADVEGATGLYIGGRGVVSGQCEIFGFGVGQTAIEVHINK